MIWRHCATTYCSNWWLWRMLTCWDYKLCSWFSVLSGSGSVQMMSNNYKDCVHANYGQCRKCSSWLSTSRRTCSHHDEAAAGHTVIDFLGCFWQKINISTRPWGLSGKVNNHVKLGGPGTWPGTISTWHQTAPAASVPGNTFCECVGTFYPSLLSLYLSSLKAACL